MDPAFQSTANRFVSLLSVSPRKVDLNAVSMWGVMETYHICHRLKEVDRTD